MLYQAADSVEPEGTIAHYGSRIIAGLYNQMNHWEDEMPNSYRRNFGVNNADSTDIQNMRRNVARKFSGMGAMFAEMARQQKKKKI